MNRFFIKWLVLFLFMFSIVVVSCGTLSSSAKEEYDPDPVKTIDIEGEGRYYYKVNENRDGIIITRFAHVIDVPRIEWNQKKAEVKRATVVIPRIIDGLPVVELGDEAFQGHCLGRSFSGDVSGFIYVSNKPYRYEVSIDFIDIPPTVTRIGSECFKGSTVQRIVLPEHLKIVRYGTFAETKELEEITLPDNLEIIGARAFAGSNLKSIKLPKNLEKIEMQAFRDCEFFSEESKTALVDFGVIFSIDTNPASDFKYDLNSERTGVIIKKYTGERKKVIIPSVIEDFPVVELASGAFFESDIVSVVIPDSVVKIWGGSDYPKTPGIIYSRPGAFSDCALLEKVILPKGLKIISESCFVGCSSLKEITLPEGLEEIEKRAFSYSGLESIVIPDSVKKLNGFSFCKKLKTVTIGRGVQEIGESTSKVSLGETKGGYTAVYANFNVAPGAFSGCTALTTVIGGDNVGKIGDEAFENCTSLTNISIGKKLQVVGNSAFKGCTSLTTFTMDNNLKKDIGSEAFKGCKKLTTVTIGDNLISIGGSAFEECEALTTVSIGDNLKSIGSFAFSKCRTLITVTIGKGIKEMGDGAFSYCSSLTTFNIGSTESVNYSCYRTYVFEGCSSLSLKAKARIMETGYKGQF